MNSVVTFTYAFNTYGTLEIFISYFLFGSCLIDVEVFCDSSASHDLTFCANKWPFLCLFFMEEDDVSSLLRRQKVRVFGSSRCLSRNKVLKVYL